MPKDTKPSNKLYIDDTDKTWSASFYDTVRESVRLLHSNGWTYKEIAKAVNWGCSDVYIRNVAYRKKELPRTITSQPRLLRLQALAELLAMGAISRDTPRKRLRMALQDFETKMKWVVPILTLAEQASIQPRTKRKPQAAAQQELPGLEPAKPVEKRPEGTTTRMEAKIDNLTSNIRVLSSAIVSLVGLVERLPSEISMSNPVMFPPIPKATPPIYPSKDARQQWLEEHKFTAGPCQDDIVDHRGVRWFTRGQVEGLLAGAPSSERLLKGLSTSTRVLVSQATTELTKEPGLVEPDFFYRKLTMSQRMELLSHTKELTTYFSEEGMRQLAEAILDYYDKSGPPAD